MQKYRPDIDGLRALAVVPVVLFHGGIPGFSGGYVGVDIFFVISGYLITSIIASEINAGRFSIISFYERRIRRILPALFSVIAVTTVVAFLLLLPTELKAYGRSVVATILFASNILFWREADYFDATSETKPLLHTWSLAVEEQFYIVFPIALWVCYRYLRSHVVAALIAAAVISFALSAVAQINWPQANFYLPFPRAWELLLGSILALNVAPSVRSGPIANIVASLGLAAICASVFLFDGETPFPGPSALLPTFGAAAIIYAGTSASSYVKALLGLRAFVFIGLISYSFYLWHWPVLVFAKMFALRDLTHLESTAAIFASLIFSIASWRYVERPFRTRTALTSARGLFSTTFVSMAAFISLGSIMVATSGLPQRMSKEAQSMASTALEAENFEGMYGCATHRLLASERFGPCPIGIQPSSRPQFLVWGDSHAMALKPMFDEIFKERGMSGFLISIPGCPPIFEIERVDYGIPCAAIAEELATFLETSNIKKVVLVGSWNGILFSKNTVLHGVTSDDDKTRIENVTAGLQLTLKRLQEAGIEVAFVMPTPGAKHDAPQTLARSIILGRNPDIRYRRDEYETHLKPLRSMVSAFEHKPDAVIYLQDYFCTDLCDVERDNRALYFDGGHPSNYLNKLMAPVVGQQLAPFMK